jgi:hypothetical protein
VWDRPRERRPSSWISTTRSRRHWLVYTRKNFRRSRMKSHQVTRAGPVQLQSKARARSCASEIARKNVEFAGAARTNPARCRVTMIAPGHRAARRGASGEAPSFFPLRVGADLQRSGHPITAGR